MSQDPNSVITPAGGPAPTATATPAASGQRLLEVRNLVRYFPVRSSGLVRRTVGQVQAVDDVSFGVDKGQALGLVGESGCGKSTTGRLVTRLDVPTSGSIEIDGTDIASIKEKDLLPFRRDVQIIFQDPYSSLNPRHTVGSIIGTPAADPPHRPGEQDAVARPGTARDRRPEPGALQPLPERVLRRPAAAHRHRPRARPAARS